MPRKARRPPRLATVSSADARAVAAEEFDDLTLRALELDLVDRLADTRHAACTTMEKLLGAVAEFKVAELKVEGFIAGLLLVQDQLVAIRGLETELADVRARLRTATRTRFRAEKSRRSRPGVTRSNYFTDGDLNPQAEAEERARHLLLSKQFRTEFRSHPDAIFQYVAHDAMAFRAPWVHRAIERWEAEGNSEALHRLMNSYADARGKTPLPETALLIRRDQLVYRRYRRARRGGRKKYQAIRDVQAWLLVRLKFSMGQEACRQAVDNCEKYHREFPQLTDRQFFVRLTVMRRNLQPRTQKATT